MPMKLGGIVSVRPWPFRSTTRRAWEGTWRRRTSFVSSDFCGESAEFRLAKQTINGIAVPQYAMRDKASYADNRVSVIFAHGKRH